MKQWAAVATQRGDTKEPPHTCWPPCCRLTCQGQSSMRASVPPTMRSSLPTSPQSKKKNKCTCYCQRSLPVVYFKLFFLLSRAFCSAKVRLDEFLFLLFRIQKQWSKLLCHVLLRQSCTGWCRRVQACETGHATMSSLTHHLRVPLCLVKNCKQRKWRLVAALKIKTHLSRPKTPQIQICKRCCWKRRKKKTFIK